MMNIFSGPCSICTCSILSHSLAKLSGTADDFAIIFPNWFSFIRTGVACAILERPIYFDPPSETTASRYLKLVMIPNFCLLS